MVRKYAKCKKKKRFHEIKNKWKNQDVKVVVRMSNEYSYRYLPNETSKTSKAENKKMILKRGKHDSIKTLWCCIFNSHTRHDKLNTKWVFTLCRINVIAMISVTDLIFMYFDYSNLKCLISTNFEFIQLNEYEVGNTDWKANEKKTHTTNNWIEYGNWNSKEKRL